MIYTPTILPGATGPVTLAGNIALAIAESLAGLVMHQLERPGAPFIFGSGVSPMDMNTMVFPYGTSEFRLSELINGELSRHYRLPVWGYGCVTDSKVTDAQAGAESALSALLAAMAGTNLIHDVGYLDLGLTGSLESILLGAEQIRWVKHFLAGMRISEATLALGVIDKVGPGGQFLEQAHTLKHVRQVAWRGYVTDRLGYDAWAANGSKDYQTRAREFCRQILKTHQPPPLEASMDAALRKLCHLA
jgi:trimethylamine--corrinoid protein Co-methyltransferase